jgi:hypothetical protein
MNEDMNAEHGSVGTMNDAGKPVADAATVAVIMTLAKLYQVVIVHRSFKRGVNQITKGTLDDARTSLEGLPQPAHTMRAVAQIAKVGWGAEDCRRLAVATLKKAIRKHSNELRTLPTSDATGDDTSARELWQDITILDVAVRDLEKNGVAEKLARKTWALAMKIGQEIDVNA